jgi:hypothetical protein
VYVSAGTGVTNIGSFLNLGLDAQGVYVSQVVTPATGGTAIGNTLFSIPKTDLLLNPPVMTNVTFFGVLPVSTYGYNIKPAVCLDESSGGDVLATAGRGIAGDNNTTLFAFAVRNASGPGPATLTRPHAIVVPAYASPRDALQPDGSRNLEDWNATLTANVQRVGGTLLGAAATQTGGRPAVRWYRVDARNYILLESGTLSEPNLDLYYPSIAANTNGTVILAFNGSSTNTFVSCYAAVGQTLNGATTFSNRLVLQTGVASFQNPDSSGNNDWGHYSTTCTDPIDPNIFWTINTYAFGSTTWATQITQLLTSPSPVLSIVSAGGNLVLSWPLTAVPFQLESAANLSSRTSWSPETQTATTKGSTVSVLVSPTNTSALFRLIQFQ